MAARAASPPPGATSAASGLLLARAEERIALVTHGAQVRYLLLALEGTAPTPLLERVDLAVPYELARAELEQAILLLEEWTVAPAF